ncbi:hypothetical protein F3Y22_tig00110391pilonHSYRG00084 [Hibiscus syriacus]|uniref:Uncharacterized protein n=1 Tax=Hibiscus syriacus TaxID=106335 RepID=A0A6A3APR1_HIBSY|nr:uncharacterized protein LOC120123228 [Hibiscus syriacus]KAE8706620.1 hypothetical protein F3Y22_tig00110391pilonHSYRG00084 [Hibiscus syriacus]
MDPCPFVRILVGNFALKFPPSTNTSLSRIHPSTSPYFAVLNSPTSSPGGYDPVSTRRKQLFFFFLQKSVAACFSLDMSQMDRIVKGSASCKVSIMVYAGPDGSTCGLPYKKLLGKVSVPLDLRGAESRPCVVHKGWITIGRNRSNKDGSSPQLSLTVRTEPDPRFVFRFGGEPECSPQVFQVQGSLKQAVFTCKFGFRNSSDRNLGSRSSLSESKTSRNWLASLKSDKDQFCKERKGWSITIHNLSGSPVAMASMVTPFVPSLGLDRVTRSNPGAWLILRPGCGTWKPWGRLEAWREPGFTDALGYRFNLFDDDIAATNATTTIAASTISTKHGGKFTMDTTTTTSNVATTPSITPPSSGDLGSGSSPGSGSGSDFGSWTSLSPQKSFRWGGFVMSSTVEGAGRCSKPEVEVGVNHVTCTEDAAAFVALAAAMDLSMDACLSFSTKLRKELRQQTQKFVV